MNAALFVTLVCALARMTSAQPVDCSLVSVKCAGCTADERAINVPGSCCPICRPAPGGTAEKVCPLLCPLYGGTCVQGCPLTGCPNGQLCCSNGCGNTCTRPVTVVADSPRHGGPTQCVYNGQMYKIGEIFFNVGPSDCQECQCKFNGNVVCKGPDN